MDKKLHCLETFHVQDLHGAIYKVHAYEHLTHVDTLMNMETQWEPTGLIEFKLSTGEHLVVGADGSMHLPGSTMPLHKLSPVAHVQ